MSVGNRGFRGKVNTGFDRRSSDQPENIGNRKTFDELKIPPDDVGNQVERDLITSFVHDGLGNSLDEEPSHLRSGILSQLEENRERASRRMGSKAHRNVRSVQSAKDYVEALPAQTATKLRNVEEVCVDTNSLQKLTGEDYMAHLANEFSRLLRQRQGLPFAFSMKPVADNVVDEALLKNALDGMEKLVRDILSATGISASLARAQYRTAEHRFAVFFLSPKERDPLKNKDLISALRQIIKLHLTKYPPGQVNVLLVLANAQHVIEDHLFKLGARRLDD